LQDLKVKTDVDPVVLSERELLRDQLTVLTGMIFLCVPAPLVLIVGIPTGQPLLIATGLVVATGSGMAIALTRAGHGRIARVGLTTVIFVCLGARAVMLGGVFSLAYLAWPVGILIAGLFFGRAGILLGVITAALLGVGLALSSHWGLLPDALIEEHLLRRTAMSILLFASFAIFIDLMTTRTETAFARLAQSERKREAMIARYQHAAAGAHHGVWEFDPETQEVWLDPGVGALLGDPEMAQTISIGDLLSRVHEFDRIGSRQDLEQGLLSGQPTLTTECRVRHSGGEWLWLRLLGRPIGDRLIGSVEDVGEAKAMERELRHRAFHDSLTGLPNRDLFIDRLAQTLTECRRRKKADFAVVFIDLDRFKIVNDSLGHAAGDLLLVQLAARLRGTVREPDTVARLGGDEFTLLLRDIQTEEAAQIALERVQSELERAFLIEGQEAFVGASMGLVFGSLDYKEPQDLLRDADLAMYSVKGDVNEQVGVFESSMRREMRALLDLDTSLRKALEQGEIVPWYQPIVNLKSGTVVGFEALARWVKPDGQVLVPSAFIPRAEETGLIAELDRRIIDQASATVGAWNSQGSALLLSVNLSARQFHSKDLKTYIQATLQSSGLKAEHLQLEITEGLLLSDAPGVRETLKDLEALGVQVAFDDFGTGYSSLSYLHRFDIEVLKIDRAFIQELGPSGPGPICHAIHSMACSLGIETVAEGVETKRQRAALLELGCPYGQGFLFGAAEPANTVDPGKEYGPV